ncbi:MAG: SdpI family protein [Finegoldia sp.]|nr:SdpI family protein [Finegoldia sp.]
MKREKFFKIGLGLFVVQFIISALVYKSMPDLMPTHFNINNQADDFSSKAFALFGLPLMMLGVYLMAYFFTTKDPKVKNQNEKIMAFMLILIPSLSLIITFITIAYVRGIKLDISTWMNVILGIAFIVIGNYLPKTKRNYTMGIKLPWTLDSDYVWDKTHRLAGYIWSIGGIFLIIVSLLFKNKISYLFVLFLAMVFIPTIYSYFLYKKVGKSA